MSVEKKNLWEPVLFLLLIYSKQVAAGWRLGEKYAYHVPIWEYEAISRSAYTCTCLLYTSDAADEL